MINLRRMIHIYFVIYLDICLRRRSKQNYVNIVKKGATSYSDVIRAFAQVFTFLLNHYGLNLQHAIFIVAPRISLNLLEYQSQRQKVNCCLRVIKKLCKLRGSRKSLIQVGNTYLRRCCLRGGRKSLIQVGNTYLRRCCLRGGRKSLIQVGNTYLRRCCIYTCSIYIPYNF